MSALLKVILFASGGIYALIVLMLLVKRKINERNTLVWLSGSLIIVIVSANPKLLDWAAARIGVNYPPSLLFLFSVLILLLIVLHQSIQISILAEKLRELTQHISISQFRDGSDGRDERRGKETRSLSREADADDGLPVNGHELQ